MKLTPKKMKPMKAVILAAGEGKRLRPFTETMPKVMLPVLNKPILEHVFDSLAKTGIDEAIVVVGYKKEVIMDHFKDYTTFKIVYVHQNRQLGTAHALLQAKSHLDDSFIVLAGDNLIDSKSIQNLYNDDNKYSILISEHSLTSKYGVVFTEKGILKKIIEKPKEELSKFISTGIYKFPINIFEVIHKVISNGDYKLSSVVQSVINQGKKFITYPANYWMDIIYPWDLISINQSMAQKSSSSINGIIEKNVTLKGDVTIGKDTVIYSGCYLIGPVVIGEGCEIGPDVCVFPNSTIGNNCSINPFSEIRNSVLMDDVRISSHSTIMNSILARGNILGNNFSSLSGENTVKIDDEFIRLKDIGSMIGEDCNIGSHVVVEPGIIIGTNCKISSHIHILNNIPTNSKVM
jgi:glucose-1-phosphate thymidylyltransferase